MGEVFKVRFIKALVEIFPLSLWGLLRPSLEPCCNLLIRENKKGNHNTHLIQIYEHQKGRRLINPTKVFLLLFGLVLGMAWSAQGAIFLEDDFDDGKLDPAWTVTHNNVSGWTYEESGTNLTVTDITTTVGDPVWGKTILSRNLPAVQADFSVDFEFSWIAEEGPSTYQALYITLYGSIGEIIAFTGYLSTLGSIGQKVVVATKGDSNVDHDHWGADYQPESDYYASYTLPQSGSASIRITKVEDTIQFFWDNTLLLAPKVTSSVHGIDIQFWYDDVAVHGQSFGTESVELIRVREAYFPGDVTGDKSVDVSDVVKSLQITAGFLPSEDISITGDVSGDYKIGLEEALYGLRELAGEPGPAIVDRSDISLEDNLLTKVREEEWTLGEGLVATLKLMAGELNAESVLRHSELLRREGDGIMAMAYEYLEDGPDAEAKAEIHRLLASLVYSNEQLEAMAGIAAALAAQQVEIATAGSVVDCKKFFEKTEIPAGVDKCLEYKESLYLGILYDPGTYRIFYPAASLPTAGWLQKHYDLAFAAMEKTVPIFAELFDERMQELGKKEPPSVNIVFSVADSDSDNTADKPTAAVTCGWCNPCSIAVFTGMQSETDGTYKQIIAHELAHCFQEYMFPEQNDVKYEFREWREEGLAEHLSNVAYPEVNIEWEWLEDINKNELSTTLFDRSYENFLFFQYLENIKGNKAFIDLVKSLPTSGGRAEQEGALAGYPLMESFFHDFAKAMTDLEVVDTNGAKVPYPINEWNCPTRAVDKPFYFKEYNENPFQVSRDCLVIEEDKVTDLEFNEINGPVKKSMRPTYESDIAWTEVPSTFGLPDKDCNREVTMVVTTTAPDKPFELSNNKVVDAPCTIEGVYEVDNKSLWLDPYGFTMKNFTGSIIATFMDGYVDVVYDNWGYTVERTGTAVVVDVELFFHEKITRTINAQGTTTYTLDGDTINFGHTFESDFMTGTEKILHIKQWTPKGVVPDTHDEYEQSPDWTYRDVFTGFPNYELEGILRLWPYIWSSKECILRKLGPVLDDDE